MAKEDNKRKIRLILSELKGELTKIYGKELVGLVLYGSYAREEPTDDSDIDVFVLLKRVDNPFRERRRFADLIWEVSLKNDIVISALPIDYTKFQKKPLPIFSNAREEGIMI